MKKYIVLIIMFTIHLVGYSQGVGGEIQRPATQSGTSHSATSRQQRTNTSGVTSHRGNSSIQHRTRSTRNNYSSLRANGVEQSGRNLIFTVRGVTFKMVFVEGGTYMMGATSEQDSDANDWKKPAHSVSVSDFWIGETEVTQALWQVVMDNNPSYFKGSNRPVECVSWDDCQTFVNKLNSLLSGLLPTGRKFRLPTEAEWEYAARGGNRSGHYKYSGSNDSGSVAWHGDDCYAVGESHPNYGTHNVKTKNGNELGIYDMSGNVAEWCQDWYGSYVSVFQTNPSGPSSGTARVQRGGDWGDGDGYCCVSYRFSSFPSDKQEILGLRIVL